MRSALLFAIVAAPTWGCSCVPGPKPPCEEAWQYSAVFTGHVVSITEPPLPSPQPMAGGSLRNGAGPSALYGQPLPLLQRTIRIALGEAFLGIDSGQKTVEIQTGLGGGDCGYPFQVGMDYLVYADTSPTGQLRTGVCSRTRSLERAAEDIAYFRGLAEAPGTAEIRVLALDLTKQPPPGPDGLAGVPIEIDTPGLHSISSTDSLGRATFTGLAPGDYTVSEFLGGYRPWTGKVQLHAKGCAEVLIPMRSAVR